MEYSRIGKIQNTHGLEGKIIVKHNFEGKDIFKKLTHIFIEINRESYIPFFIEEKQNISTNETLIRLDEVTSVEVARELLGKEVLIEDEYFKKLKPKNITEDFIGFQVNDKTIGKLGEIQNIFETPGQIIASLTYKGKEILIPLLEHTILDINVTTQQIEVDLPAGLIDVYLD